MRKKVALVLTLTLMLSLFPPQAFAQEAAMGPPGLVQVEEILYGKAQEGALIPRLERVERDVLGQPQREGAVLVRLQRMVDLLTGARGEVSLKLKLNAIEWALSQKINEGPAISRRLEQMEMAVYGQAQSGAGLAERLDNLTELMWPGGRIYVDKAVLPAGTLVRIELLTELDSERNKAGDVVRYRVVDDVVIDQKVVIPAGALGSGEIISVNSAGRLGQDGLVQVDFGTVSAMDGTPVALHVAERATEQNKSLELAAGASLAGVVLLGPVGLAAGYFVRGKPHVVPVGTSFYAEVAREATVNALSLIPVR